MQFKMVAVILIPSMLEHRHIHSVFRIRWENSLGNSEAIRAILGHEAHSVKQTMNLRNLRWLHVAAGRLLRYTLLFETGNGWKKDPTGFTL